MTTYTGTRSQISLALAELLDFTTAVQAEGYESFADLADALCAMLNVCPDAPKPRPEPEVPKTVLPEAVRLAAEAAGRALGQKFTTATGERAGPCAPAPSRSAKLRYLADGQPTR